MRGFSWSSASASSTERAWAFVAVSGDSEETSSIMSATELSPSPTGVSSETGSSIMSNSSRDALEREAGVLGDLLDRGVAVQLLRQLAARALRAADLLGDVDGQPDRAALVGERAGDRLADPPRRVRRKLEAELVVELLDRADQAHVPLLDQIQERHAGLRVVAGDRHHEAQVALDQAALGALVAEILAPGELALLAGRQQAAVADLAHVELQRVGALEPLVLAEDGVLGLFLVVIGDRIVERRQELERAARVGSGALDRGAVVPRRPYRRQEPGA